MNVVTPTLTVFLPDRRTATGTGVIIAPGEAFVALTTSLEGADVARWLQQHGIAAFLLEYRLVEKKQNGIPDMDMDTAGRYGIADGIQALKVVRQHVRPDAGHPVKASADVSGVGAGRSYCGRGDDPL